MRKCVYSRTPLFGGALTYGSDDKENLIRFAAHFIVSPVTDLRAVSLEFVFDRLDVRYEYGRSFLASGITYRCRWVCLS